MNLPIQSNLLPHKCNVIRFALNYNSFGFRDLNAHIIINENYLHMKCVNIEMENRSKAV